MVGCMMLFVLIGVNKSHGVFYFRVCFCKQKTAYEMRISDWSSDVCSSDLQFPAFGPENQGKPGYGADQKGIGQRQRRSVILLADRRADGGGEQRLGKPLIRRGDARHRAEIPHRDRTALTPVEADETAVDPNPPREPP